MALFGAVVKVRKRSGVWIMIILCIAITLIAVVNMTFSAIDAKDALRISTLIYWMLVLIYWLTREIEAI